MELVVGDHRRHRRCVVARPAVEGAVVGLARIPAPAGEHLGQALDVVLAVGRLRIAEQVELLGAVGIELVKPKRHQLHHFAGVVFVRMAAGVGVFLLVAQRVEVDAHHRMQGHVLQKVAVIAEGVAFQHVVIVGRAARVDIGIGQRGDEDFRQGKGHALAQLVVAGHRLLPEAVVEVVLVDIGVGILGALGHQPGVDIRQVRDARRRELGRDPVVVIGGGQVANRLVGGPEGRLGQEASGVTGVRVRRYGQGGDVVRRAEYVETLGAAAIVAATGTEGEQGAGQNGPADP